MVIERSENLVLCRSEEKDLDFVLKTEQHPDNNPFVGQWTREEHQDTFSKDDLLHLMITSVKDGKPVGYIIIAGLKNRNRSIELRRIVIAEKGKGYGRETLRLVKKLAFETLKAHRLWLDVREHNTRARTLYRSEGFTEEGVLRECILYKASYESLVVMSMLEVEYGT